MGERPPAGATTAVRPAAALVLAAAVVAAFATGLRGGFQFDDWNVIVEEARVQSLGAWWRSMPGIRPLLKLSYALNAGSGLGVLGFHAVNLAIHLGVAWLALALLTRLEARAAPAAGAPAAGTLPALLGALLFALHPAQTEAVTYLSGRSTSLAALLALASAVTWLDGRARASRWLVHGLSPLLFLGALGAKETAVALPPALLLLAASDPREPGSGQPGRGEPGSGQPGRGEPARWPAALRDTAVHWALLAAVAAVASLSPAYRAMAAHSAALRPLGENLLVHLRGLTWLAGQAVWPWRLVADPWLPASPGFPWVEALAGAGALALLGLGLATLKRPAGLAVLWWLLWLPLSGWLLPRPEPANDRQLYLALLGPAWILGRMLAAPFLTTATATSTQTPTSTSTPTSTPTAAPTDRRRLAAGLATAVLVGALGLGTAARNRVYRDEVTFWADVAAKAPGNARAFNNLGLALSAACRLPEAAAAFEAALALEPRQAQARVNLWLLRQGDPPGARRGQSAVCPP